MSWLSLPIRRDADVVAVRARVRALADALALTAPVAGRLVAAASELARWCVGARTSYVAFGWTEMPAGPWIEFHADEPLPSDVDEMVGRLTTSELLVGRRSDAGFDRVVLRVVTRSSSRANPEALRELLLQGDDATAIELLREQNREMAQLLSQLHVRDEELARALETARRSANEAAENSLRLAELARRKDEVLAIVSHDIRSPLAAVRGALSLLQGSLEHLDEDQLRLIGIANRAGDAIVELVSNVLASALLDAGESIYEPSVVDVAALVSDIAGTLEIAATQKGVALATECSARAVVLGDPTWLKQVTSNLLMNAIKFTARGGHVALRVRPESTTVLLEVADTGMGIPHEKREQVFQKLRKLHAGGTAGERGSGLGLYITKKLVDRMSGSIDFESVEGQGTTFRVRLPAATE